jgi:peptidylprolyl isomerase
VSDAKQELVFTLEGGDVVIRLRPDLAPKHVARISELASEGFYDGLTFHRVDRRLCRAGRLPERQWHGRLGPEH